MGRSATEGMGDQPPALCLCERSRSPCHPALWHQAFSVLPQRSWSWIWAGRILKAVPGTWGIWVLMEGGCGWKEKEAPIPLGKPQFPFRWECVLVSGVLCFLEDVEGLNGGSVAVPRIGWDSDNCLRLPIPGSAAVPCNRAVSHIS